MYLDVKECLNYCVEPRAGGEARVPVRRPVKLLQ